MEMLDSQAGRPEPAEPFRNRLATMIGAASGVDTVASSAVSPFTPV